MDCVGQTPASTKQSPRLRAPDARLDMPRRPLQPRDTDRTHTRALLNLRHRVHRLAIVTPGTRLAEGGVRWREKFLVNRTNRRWVRLIGEMP